MTPGRWDQAGLTSELSQATEQGSGPVTELAEIDLAHGLPDWDLLPPAEFLRRHRRNPAT